MTDPGYDIRAFEPDDEAAVLALFRTSLGWKDEPRFRQLFKWKHLEGPWGPSPAWVAEASGRIVGYRAMMNWRFTVGGDLIRAVRAIDTATDPEFRGRGIFRALTLHSIDVLRERGVGFVFNTPNDQSRPGYLKMGWQIVGRIPILIMPRGVRFLARTVRARTSADLWSIPSSIGVAVSELIGDGPLPSVELRQASQRSVIATYRTLEFVKWRYGLDELNYRATPLGEVDGRGWLVFRVRKRGPARELVVVDTIGTAAQGTLNFGDIRKLLRATSCDHALLTRAAGTAFSGLTAPGMGPVLAWRGLGDLATPHLEAWQLTMGDLELF